MNTCCANCKKPITGNCVSTQGRQYHHDWFETDYLISIALFVLIAKSHSKDPLFIKKMVDHIVKSIIKSTLDLSVPNVEKFDRIFLIF